jgi:hypothetical protein
VTVPLRRGSTRLRRTIWETKEIVNPARKAGRETLGHTRAPWRTRHEMYYNLEV